MIQVDIYLLALQFRVLKSCQVDASNIFIHATYLFLSMVHGIFTVGWRREKGHLKQWKKSYFSEMDCHRGGTLLSIPYSKSTSSPPYEKGDKKL